MIIIEIAGFLGADPEERYTASGKRVVSLRVATHVRQGGKDHTVWWHVNIWDDRFDKMIPYLKKGSGVIVLGDMGKPETYVSKDGTTKVALNLNADIIKFSPFGRPDGASPTGRGEMNQNMRSDSAAPAQEQFATFGAGLDQDSSSCDDLPF